MDDRDYRENDYMDPSSNGSEYESEYGSDYGSDYDGNQDAPPRGDGDFDFPETDVDYSAEFDDAEDGVSRYKKEYTVSTQGFYEQYGAEIRASVKEVDEEEIYSEYDDEPETEGEYEFPKKKRKKKHYLLKFLVLCLIIAAGVAFALSPFFNIKIIKVQGEHNYKAEDIIKASGVKAGMNIFKVRESDVQKRIKKNAYFSSVSIKRKLPKQLTIVVRERNEAAYVKYGKSKVVIDPSAVVLRKTTKAVKLTELANLKIKKMDIGDKLDVSQETTLKKTLDVIKAMRAGDIFFSKIEFKKVILRAYIRDNFVCKGDPDTIIENIENGNLKNVISDLYKKGKKKGTITLGDNDYCSYSPKVL